VRHLDLAGPVGRLEALLEEVPGARFAALVCHPHPQFGGTMQNHATHRLARAVRTQGGTTLRFNYRGVGRSEGSYDRGRGEADDARAALSHLRRLGPARPLLLCGFSFGAWISVLAAGEEGVVGLLLAGLAVRSAELDSLRDPARVRTVPLPVAVVQAELDEYGTPPEVERVLAGSSGPRRLAAVHGVTHLFSGGLPALEQEAGAAVEWLRGAGGRW
jgi:uncharacterized protein